MIEDIYSDIRPYNNDEVPNAVLRMTKHPHFQMALDYLFTKEEQPIIFNELASVSTNFEFQKLFMYRAIKRILEKSSDGLSTENVESLVNNGPSVFVANHRDILLDSAILQVVMVDNGLETSEITFGSNLMVNDFIIDFGKTNRMFTVFREGSPREMLENSKRLSAYMHNTITEKKISAWIAQRKGRTKDGLDKTDSTVLKMLTTYDRKNPLEAFKQINILPVITSYEWEPCDLMKLRELYLSKVGKYEKQSGEDLNSVLHGIIQPKGRIHMAFGTSVNEFLEQNQEGLDKHNIHTEVARFIDSQVYKYYKIFPNQYWAFDQLNNTQENSEHYDSDIEQQMLERLEELYKMVGCRDEELKKMFFQLYANPLKQKNFT
ncbi:MULTISPECIES: hypothetical protein [unclassified Lentimicrobium]|uniref:hypothetical protein n=1 Tax=unclassified Lentimicrobium TaxID=2677434 RepID=UPI00155555A2|nr:MULTISPECIES: hypothetical protein [unclassified Lentimicrobium]NPD46228.1 hypothetical protein [Lentimicrobium sp. S6]NPD86278.1 hypothetical protein [Lentimicrobium sp. L6]